MDYRWVFLSVNCVYYFIDDLSEISPNDICHCDYDYIPPNILPVLPRSIFDRYDDYSGACDCRVHLLHVEEAD